MRNKHAIYCLFYLLLLRTSLHAQSSTNQVFLSWLDGPAATFNGVAPGESSKQIKAGSDRLIFRSSYYALMLNSRNMDVTRITLNPPAGDPATPLSTDTPNEWHPSSLKLTCKIDDQLCTSRMSKSMVIPDVPRAKRLLYPVRIIESGNYFNHVAIYGLEWVNKSGKVYSDRGHMEVRAWGDSCVVEFHVDPENDLQDVELKWDSPLIGFSHSDQIKSIERTQTTVLRIGFEADKDGITPLSLAPQETKVICTGKRNKAVWNEATACWEIQIANIPRDKSSNVSFDTVDPYPDDQDQITEVPFRIRNEGEKPADVKLRFINPKHSITGFVLMLLDKQGKQTGIPVQTSKNWHKQKELPLPYEGTWIRGSARVTVPAKSSLSLRYAIVHCRWQSIPAASAGQLSLVGWGHNGFWTQMALGSWGEHFCIQPGRLQRRAFVTDVRPLMVYSQMSDKPWGWTPNVGGCDTVLVIDKKGRYLPWGGVASDFIASGPNLALVRVKERSADDAIFLQTDTYLPRSADFLRVFMNIRMVVRKQVDFKRLALFQLGTDYYNSNHPTSLSYGAGKDLTKTIRPQQGKFDYASAPTQLGGKIPWVTLVDNKKGDSRNIAEGTRGLIVRHFQAVLDGKEVNEPWVSAYRSQHGDLCAEIVPPPEIKRLRKGDSIDMQLELAVIPLESDKYYGKDIDLKKQLKLNADTWKMTSWEAVKNSPRLEAAKRPSVSKWPLTLSAANKKEFEFSLTGGSGLIPIRITNLTTPDGWKVIENFEKKKIPLGDRYKEEMNPQLDFDRNTDRWTVTLSLRPPASSDTNKKRSFLWVNSEIDQPDQ